MSWTKEQILEAYRKLAKGKTTPPGRRVFMREAGIREIDWLRHWEWSALQREAGYEPNTRHTALPRERIISATIALIRKTGKFPTRSDLKREKANNHDFLNPDRLFSTKVGKQNLAKEILVWCSGKQENEDIVQACQVEAGGDFSLGSTDNPALSVGVVYLAKHKTKRDTQYKIGRTKNTVRRGQELRTELPGDLELIHEIKTDDPSGIENYWHKRFSKRRLNGEWFDLSKDDIKAFKRMTFKGLK